MINARRTYIASNRIYLQSNARLKENSNKKSYLYLLPAIALLTLAVFFPVLWHDFVDYDDLTFVVLNPHIQSGVTLDGIIWAFTSAYEANWVPLTWLSHMLDVQLFGMNAAGHHFVNLLLHIASTLLLFIFFKGTTNAPWRSAAVALLFALHPLHVESVAWVAERKDVLSAFFWMLTMCAYAHYTDRPETVRYLIVLGLFSMGLLAKPMLVTMPCILLLLDWWPLRRLPASMREGGAVSGVSLLRLIGEKIPFFILSLCASVITYLAQHADISYQLSFLEKATRALVTYAAYLAKMFWPSNLAVLYPFSFDPPSLTRIIISGSILLVITGVVFMLRRLSPYLITGWMWYLITLLPVIGLVHIGHHSMADRYTYIPLIGIFSILVWGTSDVSRHWCFKKVFLGILFSVTMVALVVITQLQLRHWKNSITLFSHAVAVTEKNWMAHNNLGKVILDEGRIDEAIMHFTKAVEANPSYALAHLNRGFAYYFKYDFPAARESFERAIQADSSCHPAHFGLGLVYLGMGKRDLAQIEYGYLLSSGSPRTQELMTEILVYDSTRAAAHGHSSIRSGTSLSNAHAPQ